MIYAFSVFTHMEHEDSYLYLKEALRIVRPGGRFVFSCLPVDTTWGEEVFLGSAERDLQTRYRTVRHVVTSRDLKDDIARLAGWTPVGWRGGDEEDIRLPDDDEPHKFQQTICVLKHPGDEVDREGIRSTTIRFDSLGWRPYSDARSVTGGLPASMRTPSAGGATRRTARGGGGSSPPRCASALG